MNSRITLAIDTSCDETSVAVVNNLTVLSNIMPSQMEYHQQYGGVVPILAKLAHQERIDSVVNKALHKAKISINRIDSIAVTHGPGLAMALEIGIKKAKELASKYNKPLITINHMEGHLLSSFVERNTNYKVKTNIDKKNKTLISNFSILKNIKFPVLGFLVSGGHTELILVSSIGNYKKIGETLDDSCGEAYDKCGRMLGLGYPAGPVISKFAKLHYKNMSIVIKNQHQSKIIIAKNLNTQLKYELPIPMVNSGDLNFSFSGLKTAFNKLIELNKGRNKLNKTQILDLCVTFEAAALSQLSIKLDKAITIYKPNEVWLGGGVIASVKLRSELRKICNKQYNKIKLRYPYSLKLTGDNAAMIGVSANIKIISLKLKKKLLHTPKYGIYLKDFDLISRDPQLDF